MLDNLIHFNGDRSTRDLMADAKFFEGYSRWDESKNRYETWNEAVERVMDMHRKFYADVMTDELSLLIDEAEELYKQKYFLGAQRALQFGGDQLIKHQMRLYNCFSGDTQFITRYGVAKFNDFNDGDVIQVKTHTNSWKSAVVRRHGKQKLYNITFTKKGSTQTVRATRDHTWILKDGTRTTNLSVGDKLLNLNDSTFESFNWDISSVSEKLAWCYGYVYGDGTVTQTSSGPYSLVRLCGDDVRFRYRFEEMGFKTSTTLSLDGDFFAYTGRYEKTLPSEADTIENLRAFVWGLLEADGEKSSSYWADTGKSFANIYQVKSETKEFIRKIFPVVGAYIISEKDWTDSNFTTVLSGKEYVRTGSTFNISTTLGAKGSAFWTVQSIDEDVEEDVWCVEVEDDHSFVLKSGIVTGNCTSSYADRKEFFGEFFYILLCGAGAGVSVQKHHIAKLPKIQPRTKQAKIFTPNDSIEGWADCADILMSSYFVGGGKHPDYEGRRVYFDLSKIREKGAMINGGFKAPGPEPLRRALDKIEHLLQGLVLKGVPELSPIHVYDICMHLADAVLAGGVRRSATIFLFSPDDEEMMKAKTGNWFLDNPQRGRSNNSAVIVRGTADRKQFARLMQSVREFGEPGFVFTESTEHTFNPCVEIGKYPVLVQEDGTKISGWQGCNLTEINGAKANTKKEFLAACRGAAILGTLQAGYTKFKFVSETTRKIFEREALLGVSITGWMNNPHILLDESILQEGATLVKSVNKEVAKIIGINPAARTTCCKPAGNASVLLQTASGVHGEHSPLYIRNVQMNKDSEVAQLLKETNPYMVEESVWSQNKSDYVISFPVISPATSIWKKDLYGVNLLEKVKLIQQNWVEYGTDTELCVDPTVRHNVSNTISILSHQWEEVEEYLFENRAYFAGVSMLSATGDKDFAQAPFTEIETEEEIIQKYGRGAMFASGLIVDAVKIFDSLWSAVSIANYGDTEGSQEKADIRADWIRRFDKYSENYFAGDKKRAEYCLKSVYLLHKWTKIQENLNNVDFALQLESKKFIDIDTTGSAACVGGACELT